MAKKLYICEKPSQARDIARVLGASQKQEGFIDSADVTVTWCLGHLLETAKPDHYNDSLKPWRIEKLPVIPEKWHMVPVARVKKQLTVVKRLIKQSKHIIIATDADREGELIAREVMDYCNYKGLIERLWLSALDERSIKHALMRIKPGSDTLNLYHAGLGRQRADWTVGMNMTMATSALFGKYGEGVLSVGRVQTPTLQLIVTRDRLIDTFKSQTYYELYAQFMDETNKGLWLKWVVSTALTALEQGICLNQAAIIEVAQSVHQQSAQVQSNVCKQKKQSPPLPFTLSSLQKKASALYGFTAKKTLSIAQELYEKYKATTYPRTDSGYLPRSQFNEAQDVLAALMASDPSLIPFVKSCDFNYLSPAWNDKKVGAHHGIIPTRKKLNLSSMPQDCLKIYLLIRTVYVAQFLGDYVYKHSKLTVICAKQTFIATGNIPMVRGWKKVLSKDKWGETPKGKDETNQDLPDWQEGQFVREVNAKVVAKQTKPPNHFTEGTLIGAMESVGKYVEDPKLKKILKETSGIGTQATRASIIELLIKRDYITRNQKNLISTEKGRSLVDLLPLLVKDPATTALWEQALEEIACGARLLDTFLADQKQNLSTMLESLSSLDTSSIKSTQETIDIKPAKHACAICAKPMARRKMKAKNRYFWGCTRYPDCTGILPDFNGKPGRAKAEGKSTNIKCDQCDVGFLVERKGKFGNFYGCSKYPQCKHLVAEIKSK